MIENLQDELYQLENKQAKSAKLHANIRSRRAKNVPKTFFKVLERQNMQKQTIFELYNDDNISKYSSNLKDILQSAKKLVKNSAPSKVPQLLLLNLLAKFLTKRKNLMNPLIFVRLKYL